MMWPRKSAAGIVQETGVLHRGGSDDDVADAIIEATLDGIEVADAAAELDRNFIADFLDDFLDRPFVLRLAGKGAVEIDHMQAARALFQPVAAWRRGLENTVASSIAPV